MAQLIVRNLDEETKRRLRERAARHGRSMEAETRDILQTALFREGREPRNLAALFRELFGPEGGVDLPDLRDRTPHEPISFVE